MTALSIRRDRREAIDILLVEDDLRQCAEFREFFDRLGFSYRILNNGQRALELLDQLTARIVLLDIRLPGADGVAVAKSIMQHERRPLVVLMSGHIDSVYEANQSSVKVFPVVEKPIDFRTLARFIREALGADRV